MSGADDPSAYLRPSRVKDTIDQTRMFDSKKWTWIPDDEESFKSASIKSQKGERLVVELDDGQVCVHAFAALSIVHNWCVYKLCCDSHCN